MPLGSADYLYHAVIARWIDGDTCVVEADLGFRIVLGITVRIYGLNCDELHARHAAERERALAAKTLAESLAPPGTLVLIQSYKSGSPKDGFGRWLASITLDDGTDFTKRMIEAGQGEEYLGESRV